jgi:hypothetical protein
MMQHCRFQSSAQFVPIVFEAHDEHPATLKDMLAGKGPRGCQRKTLSDPQRGFSDAPVRNQR